MAFRTPCTLSFTHVIYYLFSKCQSLTLSMNYYANLNNYIRLDEKQTHQRIKNIINIVIYISLYRVSENPFTQIFLTFQETLLYIRIYESVLKRCQTCIANDGHGNLSWEADTFSHCQEISITLSNPKIYYRVQHGLSIFWARII